jgi:hypothetical protein
MIPQETECPEPKPEGCYYLERSTEMPVRVTKIGGKFRIVEGSGDIAKNNSGTPLDGGGHESQEKASAQARAINASLKEKGKI